jgi:hypothetical protein
MANGLLARQAYGDICSPNEEVLRMAITFGGPTFIKWPSDVEPPDGWYQSPAANTPLGYGAVVAWALKPYYDGTFLWGHAVVMVAETPLRLGGFTAIYLDAKTKGGEILEPEGGWEPVGHFKDQVYGSPGYEVGVNSYRTKWAIDQQHAIDDDYGEGPGWKAEAWHTYRTRIILCDHEDTPQATETGPELELGPH